MKIKHEDGLLTSKILDNGISFYNDFIYLFSENNIQRIDLYNLFVDRENPILNLTLSEYIAENFDRRKFKISDNEINLTSTTNVLLNLFPPSVIQTATTS